MRNRYLEEYAKPLKRSWSRDEVSLKPIRKFFDCHVSDVTPGMITAYRTQRAKKLAPATVNKDLALLRKMLNLAVMWRMIQFSPVSQVKPLMLPENNERSRFLSDEEEKRLLKACEVTRPFQAEYLSSMVIIALHTGMRVSEILSLKWSDANLAFGFITIEATNSKAKRLRRIPINSLVRETIEGLKTGKEREFVFAKPDGSRFFWIDSAFRSACRRAKINDLHFHDLRHTFGSRLAQAGVPLTTIKELMGHSTIRMTERYCHASGQREAVEALLKRNPGQNTVLIDQLGFGSPKTSQ